VAEAAGSLSDGAGRGRTGSIIHRHGWLTPYLLLAPGLVFLTLFFLVPLGFLGYQSLETQNPIDFTNSFDWAWHNYSDALSTYHGQLIRSFEYAAIATGIAMLVGYPLAYWIAFRGGRWKNVLLLFIIGPFFVTYLIRTLAWETILSDSGIVARTACHVPGAQRQVDLMIYDNQSKARVAEQQGVPVFEPRAAAPQGDETLDALALWRIVTALNPKDNPGKVTLRGRLEVRTGAEAHQLGDRSGLRLLHHAAAVELHRLLADAEIACDLLVEPALNDEPEHVALAGRQRVEPHADAGDFRPISPCLAIAPQRAVDDVEQGLVAERLLEEIDRAGLDRAHARGYVGMTADEDDRDVMPGPVEAFLELEAARTR